MVIPFRGGWAAAMPHGEGAAYSSSRGGPGAQPHIAPPPFQRHRYVGHFAAKGATPLAFRPRRRPTTPIVYKHSHLNPLPFLSSPLLLHHRCYRWGRRFDDVMTHFSHSASPRSKDYRLKKKFPKYYEWMFFFFNKTCDEDMHVTIDTRLKPWLSRIIVGFSLVVNFMKQSKSPTLPNHT